MGGIGAVGENVDEEDVKGADSNHRCQRCQLQALPPGYNSETVHLWPFPRKRQEDTGRREAWFAHFLEPVSAHRSQTKTRRVLLCLTDTSGLGRTTRFKCGIQKKKGRKKETQTTDQAGAGDHHRLIPQLLTYREQGQDLAGVPCDIGLVVSVYAPGNICLGAKPTCMHGWQAVLRRPVMRSRGSVSIFTL